MIHPTLETCAQHLPKPDTQIPMTPAIQLGVCPTTHTSIHVHLETFKHPRAKLEGAQCLLEEKWKK